MKFTTNQARYLIKYFCCANCFNELMEVLVEGGSDVKCRVCECENLITKTTAEIKVQKEMQRGKEIRTKIIMFEIEPLYNPKDFNEEDALKSLGF